MEAITYLMIGIIVGFILRGMWDKDKRVRETKRKIEGLN